MCGIAGILSLDGRPLTEHDQEVARRMTSRMRHRGPDDTGLYISDHCILGHRRLSIIDLSSEARQPMQHGASVIAFNGEIYNYRALASQTPNPGARSDTAVLLDLFAAEGTEALSKLHGFFTFAYWDERQNELTIARDALGKKPLYYTAQRGRLYFASELRALIFSRTIHPKIDRGALALYLGFYSLPAPHTLVEGVHALPAGTVLSAHASEPTLTTNRWWRLPPYRPEQQPRETILTQLREHIERAVQERLVSDVPVASFLSGGLDSNVVTALMAANSSRPIETYTLGFRDAALDERALAETGARAFGTEHHELEITEQTIFDWLPDFFDALDVPTGDGLNTYLVARAAHEANPALKVVVSGAGGDELFLGYKKYRWLAQHRNIRRLVAAVPRAARRSISDRLSGSAKSAQNAFRFLLSPERARVLFSERDLATLTGVEVGRIDSLIGNVLESCSHPSETHASVRLQRLDLENYLPNMLLRDLDVMTMSQQLEARAPFVDRLLVEYMQQVSIEEKAKGPTKSLLAEAFADVLPDSILHAPKRGFELPMARWLRDGALQRFVTSLATGELALVRDGLLDRTAVALVGTRFRNHQSHYLTVWSIVALEEWYKHFMREACESV